jgi:nucleotide-binding universal stress UspA family protein
MAQISRILVATDFSGAANAAVKRAARLAHDLRAELHLAHVVEDHLLDRLRELVPGGDAGAEPPTVAAARARLTELAGVLVHHYSICTEVHVSLGVPYTGIVEAARAVDAGLLVLGAQGLHSYREFFLGSTTSKALRLVAGPVLVVRNGEIDDYQSVLVAVDFSTRAAPAIDLALTLAPRAHLEVIHVVETPPEEALRAWGVSDEARQALREREFEAAQRQLAALRFATQTAEQLHPVVEYGPPAQVVLQRAVQMRHKLVVVGRRGESTEQPTLLGGVAKHVLDDALCDVLVTG